MTTAEEKSSPASSRRHVVVFLCVFCLMLALALYASSRLANIRGDQAVNFSALRPGMVVADVGLTRRQRNDLKLGYAENYDPPQVAVFGTHQAQYFSQEVFGENLPPGYFFNFSLQGVALPGVRDMLAYLEERNRLPKQLILVNIMSPHLHNGRYIISHYRDVPLDIVAFGIEKFGLDSFVDYFTYLIGEVSRFVGDVFSYETFLIGLFAGEDQVRVIDVPECTRLGQAPTSHDTLVDRLANFLPRTVLHGMGLLNSGTVCKNDRLRKNQLNGATRRDGSMHLGFGRPLILNEHGLGDIGRGLKFGDEQRIARYMREIAEIGERNGVKVVFFIPPVYETARSSIVNDIMTSALELAKGLTVIDDRFEYLDGSRFYDYRHPKSAYFKSVVARLRQRGLGSVLN